MHITLWQIGVDVENPPSVYPSFSKRKTIGFPYLCKRLPLGEFPSYSTILYHIFLYTIYVHWLVASTPLKNISQLGRLLPIYGTINNVPNQQPAIYVQYMS